MMQLEALLVLLVLGLAARHVSKAYLSRDLQLAVAGVSLTAGAATLAGVAS